MQNTIETPLPEFFGTAQGLMFGTEIVEGSREDDFTYLPLSLVCSTIGEQVERALNWRISTEVSVNR